MKTVLLIVSLFFNYGIILAMNSISKGDMFQELSNDTTQKVDNTAEYVKNSYHYKDTLGVDSGLVVLSVLPKEACNASIMLIQKSKITIRPNVYSRTAINIDTLGTFEAPLSMMLSLGDYNIVIHKEGFKDIVKDSRFRKELNKESFEMVSLVYLKQKSNLWNNIKWINAVTAIGAGITSYCFREKILTLKKEYANAITISSAKDKRDAINRAQTFYKISSGIAWTALSGFVISWIIEGSYK